MVQIGSNLNVGKTAKLTSAVQVGKAGAAEDKQPPKAKPSAVWISENDSYYKNSNDYSFAYDKRVRVGDILILGDGAILRCVVNNSGELDFERTDRIRPDDFEEGRGGYLYP